MDALLDTHTFLWYIEGNPKLGKQTKAILESSKNSLYFSIASLWEISIKLGLGKLSLQNSFSELEGLLKQLQIEILPIAFADTECYLSLPLYDRDPFDRILIAQVINRSLVMLSQDTVFDAYAVQRLWN